MLEDKDRIFKNLYGQGDFRLPFADAALPFGRYPSPFVDSATFYSFPADHKEDPRLQSFCRYAFCPGFRLCFPGSLDFRS